jgi:hypothetical protein
MGKIKTFEDLVFKPHSVSKEACNLPASIRKEWVEAKHAVMRFDNGYGISVVKGNMFYSNGIDTYEVGILKEGVLCYDTPITDDVIAYVNADEVSNIMKQIQELK